MKGRMFTPEQVDVLLQGINPSRVAVLDGLSHLEGFDVRATMTRMFGFGMWDEEATEPTALLYELETTTKAGKPAVKVAYRAARRLTIRDAEGLVCVHEGSAVGESTMPDYKRGDAHDMAIKTAETQALKRAAINMGDQFGLSLYRKGAVAPLVRKVVGHTPAPSRVPEAKDGETQAEKAERARAVLKEATEKTQAAS